MTKTQIKKREQRFNEVTEQVFDNYIKKDSVFCDAFSEMVNIFIEVLNEFRVLQEEDEEEYEPQEEYVEEMLEGYFENKVYLYKLLGSVTISKQLDLLKNTEDYYHELETTIQDTILKVESSEESEQRKKEKVESLYYLLSLLEYSTEATMNNEIPSTKLKVSKHLASTFGKDDLVTTLYSNSIQSTTIKAELFISISPLDYITMSENHHGWDSCHRLQGAYSQGIQSYLRDDTTIVAYMASYKDNFPYNSKKWRQVVYVALNSDEEGEYESGIIPSRHYPNKINEAETVVRRILLERFNILSGSNGKYLKSSNYQGAFRNNNDCGHYLDLDHIDFNFYRYSNSNLVDDHIPNMPITRTIGASGICLNTGDILYDEEQKFLCLIQ